MTDKQGGKMYKAIRERPTAIKVIADIIHAETVGGYLQDWSDVTPLMTQEQQWDYFITLGKLIARELKKFKPTPEKEGEMNNMGCMSQTEIEKFAARIIRELNLDGWRMEWTRTSPSICEKHRKIIFIDKKWIGRYPWQAKEAVLHEAAHIFTDNKVHGLGFYREYVDLLEKFMAV